MKRVAVIGAGAAGLCAAHHLLRVNIQPVVFEQRNCLGGQWAYEDVDRNDLKEVFSSMYDNLRTNLPKQTMLFPDVPFPNEARSFMHFSVVLQYLEDYAKQFNLSDCIKFNAKVTAVEPLTNEHNNSLGERFVKWKVEYHLNNETVTDVFDAVVICTGRYSVPNYPSIPGLESFKGLTLHSHYYRRAQDFDNEKVLILGNGPSGRDMMLEIAEKAHIVYFSHHGDRLVSKLPENVVEVNGIKHVTPSGEFVFENEENSTRIDAFIPCTGYKFNFKFLNETCGLRITDRVVENLYLHLINIQYPSMVVVGIPWQIAPFPLFHQQCAYISSVFAGNVDIPEEIEMKSASASERFEKDSADVPYRYFHKFGIAQFKYNELLSRLSGCLPNPSFIESLYRYTAKLQITNLQTYKDVEFGDTGNGEFDDVK